MRASQAAYVAGFLDGDGSIHLQLVRQKEYRYGFYIRTSVSFSQSTVARRGLEHLQIVIGAGYLRDRGTGMSDLVITSRPHVMALLTAVEPFVVFKEEHVRRALELVPRITRQLSAQEFLALAHEVDAFAALNYSKRKRITAADVELHLRGKGVLCPRNDSLDFAHREDGVLDESQSMDAITRRPLERG